jgi:hypothetical protein
MSVDYHWIVATVPPEHTSALTTRFAGALAGVDLSPWHHEREIWASDPFALLPHESSAGEWDFSLWNAFNAMFVPDPIYDLSTEITQSEKEPSAFELTEGNTRFLMANRLPPAASLAFALGAERISRLPGALLTFFVPPDAVVALRTTWTQLLATPSEARNDLRERGERWLTRSVANVAEDFGEIAAAIPDMAELADHRGHGLLAVSGSFAPRYRAHRK